MRALTDTELLALWERGLPRRPIDRAILILGAAFPETPYDALADWPLGRRNQAIAELHGTCFGYGVHGWTSCPECGEKLEFELDRRMFASGSGEIASDEPIVVGERAFRLPNSRDLASIASCADPRQAVVRLVVNCLLGSRDSVDWSIRELDEIGERMAQRDTMAETRLSLGCPSCAHAWEESLDIATFVWEEIEAKAKLVLIQIHFLASAYGWAESQILSLSANRRARYLEMIRG